MRRYVGEAPPDEAENNSDNRSKPQEKEEGVLNNSPQPSSCPDLIKR